MVIDFRVRPPLGNLKRNFVFDEDFLQKYSKDCGTPIAESAKQKSMELLLKEMQQAEVERAVIPLRKFSSNANFSENIPNVYSNEDLDDILRRYPQKFIGMAGVDYFDGIDQMIRDVDHYVVHGMSQGVFFEPSVGVKPTFANNKDLYPFYAFCRDLDIPLLLTFGGTGSMYPEFYYPAVIDEVARDFPNMTIIIGHGGWPWVREICAVACNRKNVYISPDLYGVNTPGYQDYIQAANYRLQDKIIFGSAYPCLPIQDAVNFYKNSGIKEDIQEKIFYRNAMRALHLA